jgi:uncharacterized protein YlxW (UPF0749 family)
VPDSAPDSQPDSPIEPAPGSEPSAPENNETPTRRRPVRLTALVIIAVLTALLGFAIVVQVHQNSSTDNLSNLREDDLVGILDDQNARADRLRRQIAQLRETLHRLQTSGDRSAAARQQAEQAQRALGILLGTIPATGPGVTVTITDPASHLDAEDLLAVVEELRGAGAEAIQFGDVRVSTTTAFTQSSTGDVTVDGTALTAPYDLRAIGNAKTMDTALNIPGGVAAAIRNAGGALVVHEREHVPITATRNLNPPQYASPSTP